MDEEQRIAYFASMNRRQLKDLAFWYHYGRWASRDLAMQSMAYQAAAELARRGGYPCPEPVLMPEPTTSNMSPQETQQLFNLIFQRMAPEVNNSLRPRSAGVAMAIEVNWNQRWHELAIPASNMRHPRVDTVTIDQSGTLYCVLGVPHPQATLGSRTGAIPEAALATGMHVLLGWVLVPAGANSIKQEHLWTPYLEARLQELERKGGQ